MCWRRTKWLLTSIKDCSIRIFEMCIISPKEDGNGVNQVDDIPRPEIKEPDRRESQNGQDNPTNPHKKAEGKKKNCKTHNKGQGGM